MAQHVDVAFKRTIRNATDACQHCILAYSSPQSASRVNNYWVKKVYKPSPTRKNNAYMLTREDDVADIDDVVFTFRGTVGSRDVLDAIDIRMTGMRMCHTTRCHDGGKVHRGFYDVFRSVEGSIAGDLQDLETTTPTTPTRRRRNITFTGHSMGGAIAMLAAARFAPMMRDAGYDARCFAFGCPPFADRVFGNTIRDTDHFCVQLNLDVIPAIPYLSELTVMPNTLEITREGDPSCVIRKDANDVADFASKVMACGNYDVIVANHRMESYQTALSSLRRRLEDPVP